MYSHISMGMTAMEYLNLMVITGSRRNDYSHIHTTTHEACLWKMRHISSRFYQTLSRSAQKFQYHRVKSHAKDLAYQRSH